MIELLLHFVMGRCANASSDDKVPETFFLISIPTTSLFGYASASLTVRPPNPHPISTKSTDGGFVPFFSASS